MTIRVKLLLSPEKQQDEFVLPMDFRRHFISLIKTLLNNSPFYERFESSAPGYSPYVFNVHFGKVLEIVPKQEAIIIRPPVLMTFSTGLFDLMTSVCNCAIAMKDKCTVLGLRIDQIQLLPNKTIKSDTIEFKVVGHAVLKGRDDYVDNTDTYQIEEAINTHLQNKLSFFNQNIASLGAADFSPVKVVERQGLTKGVCQHYGGKITSVRGNITLSGYPASLQFLYDYGLGVRTGQGFGLLEVVKQL